MITNRFICLVIGYIFGLFQTAFIIGKLNHIDIREHGSGNSGTTNAMRTLGKKFGIITYLGDAFKCVFAILVTYFMYKGAYADHLFLLAMYTGFGVILGHNFPFYMNFKGGKGIAASSGLMLALAVYDWKFIVLGGLTFFVALYITKYVSFSSLCMTTGMLIEMIVWGQLGMIRSFNVKDNIEIYILTALLTILSFIRHRQNLIRLSNGTEPKIGQKKEA